MDHADRAAQADGARVVPWPAVALFVGTAVALAWLVALPLCLGVWFLFVEALGVNIGAGLLEGAVLSLLGQEVP